MEYNRLGKTNLLVSKLGFGGIPIMSGRHSDFLVRLKDLGESIAREALERAFDYGINFFDTALDYGDSEKKIGLALKPVRKKVVIASKSKALTYENMKRDVCCSLENLGMEYIDLYQLHFVRDSNSYNRIMDERRGAYRALVEFLEEGIIKEIGIASHNPYVLEPAIRSKKFATVQLPLNLLEQECVNLVDLAKKEEMGVIVMKPYAGGSLTQVPPKVKELGLTDLQIKQMALRYVLGQNIDTVIPGMANPSELEENIQIYESRAGKDDEHKLIEKIKQELGKTFCRRCQYCEPCPKGINISVMLRLAKYYEDYGLWDWAKKQYGQLEVESNQCTSCKKCESRCPYHLRISDEIKRIGRMLT